MQSTLTEGRIGQPQRTGPRADCRDGSYTGGTEKRTEVVATTGLASLPGPLEATTRPGNISSECHPSHGHSRGPLVLLIRCDSRRSEHHALSCAGDQENAGPPLT